MLQAVIFDLDNTLLWDDKSVEEAFQATCQLAVHKYHINAMELEAKVRIAAEEIYPTYDTYDFVSNIEISPFEAFWGAFNEEGEAYRRLREIVGDYREKSWNIGLQAVGVNDKALAKVLAEKFPEERKKHVYLYEETLDVLEALKGKYKLLLLTNGSPDLQSTKLDMSPELKPYFDHIIISGDFGKGKPDPTIFEHALDVLSMAKEEALMVGDNLYTDILGASKIGLDSVWINHHQVESAEVNPTYEIARLKELLSILHLKE